MTNKIRYVPNLGVCSYSTYKVLNNFFLDWLSIMASSIKKVYDVDLDFSEIEDGSIYGRNKIDYAFAKYFLAVQKKLLPDLQKLDLSLNEARILLFLMIRKHSTATDVSKYTGIGRTETYHYLSNLLSKGVVLSTFDRPQKYYALPYTEAVDCLVRAKQNALRAVSENKDEHQSMINSIVEGMVMPEQDGKESYQVIVGEDPVHAKIARMLSAAKAEASVLLSDRYMVDLYYSEMTDALFGLAEKGVKVRLHTSCSKMSKFINEEGAEADMRAVGLKVVDGASTPVDFVIVDDQEMIILLNSRPAPSKKQESCGFYTNNQSLIAAFKFMFNKTGGA
ncbi:putative transcriptional regulator, TrmB [Nitrososphaera viennensis EN76]|nr:putative transcriptional regulator, TrmB [Nitrososphaera viennensis EN76]